MVAANSRASAVDLARRGGVGPLRSVHTLRITDVQQTNMINHAAEFDTLIAARVGRMTERYVQEQAFLVVI